MGRKKPTDKQEEAKPKVASELNGFDIQIDTFGEIRSNMTIDKINEFLNEKVDDKKLRDRDDLDFIKKKKEQEE